MAKAEAKTEKVPAFRPLGDRLLVRRAEATKQIGNILLPDTSVEKMQKGTVLATGPGKMKDDGTRVPMQVKQGDVVMFGRYAGSELTDLGNDLMVMGENDVLGVLDNGQ